MLSWITPVTVEIPTELESAFNSSRRRTALERYRSRTEVENDHLWTAYAWMRLPIINQENQTEDRNVLLYRTAPVTRGVSPEEALVNAQQILNATTARNRLYNILMFNTRTDAANSAKIKEWLDNAEEFTALTDYTAMLTSAQTHKISLYVKNVNNQTTYVLLNNLDTINVVFKVATAIMLHTKWFGDDTERIAEAWLSGDADTICTVINEYYSEWRNERQRRVRERAIKAMCEKMHEGEDTQFRNRLHEKQEQINYMFSQIEQLNREINVIKGEYLTYKLEDVDKKSEDLIAFIESCGDKISYLNYAVGRLQIMYRTELMYFEPELMQRYFDSTRPNCVTSESPATQQLMKDVFLNNKYKILVESGVQLDTINNRVFYMKAYEAGLETVRGIPNPHHEYYNCWGDNQPNIVQALMDKDYVTAILTSFAAISGISLSDTAVLSKFVQETLYRYRDTPFLKNTETGEIITFTEYTRRYADASNETNQ